MAKEKKSKKAAIVKFIVIVCLTIIGLGIGAVSFHYYRRYAVRQEQIRMAQMQRQEEQARLMRMRKAFIKKVGPIAKQVDKSYDLLPSITIAQACLESNYGQSELAQKYNNLFGVKGTNPNTSAVLTTKEYVKEKWVNVKARFQIYDSYEASIRAHARLFQNGTTWNHNQYKHVLVAKDYKKQAKALVQDGYATDPDYAKKLTDLIEQFDLDKYDEK